MPKDICKLAAVLIISLMIGTGCSQKNKLKPVYEGFPVQSINELLQLKKRGGHITRPRQPVTVNRYAWIHRFIATARPAG